MNCVNVIAGIAIFATVVACLIWLFFFSKKAKPTISSMGEDPTYKTTTWEIVPAEERTVDPRVLAELLQKEMNRSKSLLGRVRQLSKENARLKDMLRQSDP